MLKLQRKFLTPNMGLQLGSCLIFPALCDNPVWIVARSLVFVHSFSFEQTKKVKSILEVPQLMFGKNPISFENVQRGFGFLVSNFMMGNGFWWKEMISVILGCYMIYTFIKIREEIKL